jgi:AbrB family looped-hinge helix DNA binding protein
MKKQPKIFGTVTVGERGQVVIPMKARKTLKIKKGNQLIVMSGPPGKEDIISFIPVERISQVLKNFEGHLEALRRELARQKKKSN